MALAPVLAHLLSGCVTTLPMSATPGPDDPGVRYLADRAEGRAGRVDVGDSTFIASRLRVDPVRRELSLYRFPGDSLAVPLNRLRSVEIRDFARGTLEGVGAGLLLAAAVGLTAAALSDGEGERSRAQQGLHVGGITAVFALPVGFVVGFGGGHTTRIQVRAGGGR